MLFLPRSPLNYHSPEPALHETIGEVRLDIGPDSFATLAALGGGAEDVYDAVSALPY